MNVPDGNAVRSSAGAQKPLRDHRHAGFAEPPGASPSGRPRCRLPGILDFTVIKMFHALVLGCSHFVFESAAPEQRLREIRVRRRPRVVN